MTVADDLVDLLTSRGVGVAGENPSGWSLFVDKEPPSPDEAVTIYNTGGFEPNAKWLQDFPTVQVRARGQKLNPTTVMAKILEIKDELLGISKRVINEDTYIGIWGLSDIAFLKYDDEQRPIYVMNFRIVKEPIPQGSPQSTHRQPL